MPAAVARLWHHALQQNNIQPNDTQHKGQIYDIQCTRQSALMTAWQHFTIVLSVTLYFFVMLSDIILNVVMLNVVILRVSIEGLALAKF